MSLKINDFQKNYPLKDLTTFKLGGNADLYFEAKTEEELSEAIAFAKENSLPYFIMGGGSNLVISDKGIEGVVIKNIIKEVKNINKLNDTITISSGFSLSELVNTACEYGLAGAESFAGIPGSVGGAIFGNAGAYGKSISDIVLSVKLLMPDGSINNVDKDFMAFSYRNSFIKQNKGYVVLSAVFKFEKSSKDELIAKINDIKSQRANKHPDKSIGCAGSYFKNLPPLEGESRRRAAGEVLEKSGAKTMTVGGACVFEKHANFIINKGLATATDVRNLAKKLKEAVKEKFGIELEEEVRYVGRWE